MLSGNARKRAVYAISVIPSRSFAGRLRLSISPDRRLQLQEKEGKDRQMEDMYYSLDFDSSLYIDRTTRKFRLVF